MGTTALAPRATITVVDGAVCNRQVVAVRVDNFDRPIKSGSSRHLLINPLRPVLAPENLRRAVPISIGGIHGHVGASRTEPQLTFCAVRLSEQIRCLAAWRDLDQTITEVKAVAWKVPVGVERGCVRCGVDCPDAAVVESIKLTSRPFRPGSERTGIA